MKPSRCVLIIRLLVLVGIFSMVPGARAQCNPANGNRFNLEPRPNALVQAAKSVAVIPNRAGQNNVDLVVATATDARGLAVAPTLEDQDAYYVQRSSAKCAPDFEGAVAAIQNIIDLFLPFGDPTVVADATHDAFFIVDLRSGFATDDNGVGIVRASASNLLSTTACPNGTEGNSVTCWNVGTVPIITSLNAFLFDPHIAVDSRSTGKGSGDVYVVVTQADPNNTLHTSVSFSACTNSLSTCSTPITISGADLEGGFPWVQVRPDGGITISYRNTTFPGVNPEDIKFVNCTPNGAPAVPTCGAATIITTEATPIFASSIGDVPMDDVLYPKHAHRLEADGKTVTTFLVYDRCEVAVIASAFGNFCPKTDVVVTTSNNGGASWSPIAKVSNSKGQQFFGAVATDASTGTENIAYYSTEKDSFQQRPQVFLAQISPGTTTVGTPQALTSALADAQASSPLTTQFAPAGFGDRIGLAAVGTGATGQSHAYVGFTWNNVFGTYGGVSSADMNNHLTLLQY